MAQQDTQDPQDVTVGDANDAVELGKKLRAKVERSDYQIEVVRNDPDHKRVRCTVTFEYSVHKFNGWRAAGVLLPGRDRPVGEVADDYTKPGRDSWHEIFDTLGVRSVGQAIGKDMRDALEPPVKGAGTGKPNTNAIRLSAEAQIDGLIKLGLVKQKDRDSAIEAAVQAEIERRNDLAAKKREEAEEAVKAPGAVTGVQAGNGGSAR